MVAKDQPLVSVCMITYNQQQYISKAIENVLDQQTNFNFEVIISDDASKDQTGLIIEEYIKNHPKGNCIRFYNQKNNLGVQKNFEFALKHCNSKYIALCEGDDFWTDQFKLQLQVDFLELNKNYVLCFHKVKILKTDGRVVDDFITKVPENHENIEDLALYGNYIHTPSVVFRNLDLKYSWEFEISPFGDYFLYMMLAQHGKIYYMEKCMAIYRHNVGVMSKINELDILFKSIKFYSCLISYFESEQLKKILIRKQHGVSKYYLNKITGSNKFKITRKVLNLLKRLKIIRFL